jgi:hypothetical protein
VDTIDVLGLIGLACLFVFLASCAWLLLLPPSVDYRPRREDRSAQREAQWQAFQRQWRDEP